MEQAIEGQPVCLIEAGKICEDKLRQELVNVSELRSAAHRQGFETLNDVESAVLEPGGAFSFTRKEATIEALRYREVLARLDHLSEEIKSLRK